MTHDPHIEAEIKELERVISRGNEAIKYCNTREDAEGIEDEIAAAEDRLNELQEACPDCRNYEIDEHDDMACANEYHNDDNN